ncbi:MAG TPA: anthranilate synthase component I [Bryobacterales bacterium]|nr:anthranilate synthase component I [Bryobacterales bacterium]
MLPDLATFLDHARQGNVVPVYKTVMADLETPVSAYLKLAGHSRYSFLLESVEGGEKIARYTYLGAGPFLIVEARGDRIEIRRDGQITKKRGNVFEALRELSQQFHPAGQQGLPPLNAGAVGYAGYDLVRLVERRVPAFRKDDLAMPDAVFLFFSTLLAFDHVKHQIWIIANVRCDEWEGQLEKGYRRALAEIAAIERTLARPLPKQKPARARRAPPPRSNIGREKFCRAVEKAKEYILAGDIFQVVLSQRLDLRLGVEPFEVYRALRTINPSPYMFYLKLDRQIILGSSPEMLVKVDGRNVEYRPIAGTHPRGATEAEDQETGRRLLADEKERAEHIMLVDLGRNDVGRVCEFSSVQVKELMILERYSHVIHIVSRIVGRLRAGADAFDTLMACFPAGTLSGAPKVRAMEIIAELEPTRRGIYGGSVMYLDFSGNLNSCIAIRTMAVRGRDAHIQVGAGIVADSVPEREYDETLSKAGALLGAVKLASE